MTLVQLIKEGIFLCVLYYELKILKTLFNVKRKSYYLAKLAYTNLSSRFWF